jgi:predicted porin
MHTRLLETKFAGVVRVGRWLDIFAGNPEQRAEAILAVNVTFASALTLRAQGAYARVLKDSTVEVPPQYSIVYGEAGALYKFTREWSTDVSGRYSHQEFSNAQKDGATNQLLLILGLTYAPHDWKL